MECEICRRKLDTPKELRIHKEFFHKVVQNGQQGLLIASGACPDCGATLFHQSGCVSCPACGFDKC